MQPDVACESAMEGAQRGLGLLLGTQEWDMLQGIFIFSCSEIWAPQDCYQDLYRRAPSLGDGLGCIDSSQLSQRPGGRHLEGIAAVSSANLEWVCISLSGN